MPPSLTPPAQQDFLNAVSVLSPDERAAVMKLVIALSNHGHREFRCRLALELITRVDTAPIAWSFLDQREGKQRMVVNMVNGHITGIEVNGHI